MEAILGHELGHSKLGHIRRRAISIIVSGFLVLYILSEIYKTDNFFISHGLTELTVYSKFLMFNLVIGSYTFITKPISSYLSRKAEFQADDFSFQYTDGEHLISGLLKLTKELSFSEMIIFGQQEVFILCFFYFWTIVSFLFL